MAENDFKSSLFDQNNVEICLRKAFPEHYPLKNQSEYDELKLTHKSMCTLVYLFN